MCQIDLPRIDQIDHLQADRIGHLQTDQVDHLQMDHMDHLQIDEIDNLGHRYLSLPSFEMVVQDLCTWQYRSENKNRKPVIQKMQIPRLPTWQNTIFTDHSDYTHYTDHTDQACIHPMKVLDHPGGNQ